MVGKRPHAAEFAALATFRQVYNLDGSLAAGLNVYSEVTAARTVGKLIDQSAVFRRIQKAALINQVPAQKRGKGRNDNQD